MAPADKRKIPAVGVPIAFDAEAWCLLGVRRWRAAGEKEVCAFPSASGVKILALRSGVGRETALEGARWLAGEGVQGLVSIGTAGGLHPDLRRGDLIIADRVIMEEREGEKVWEPDPACANLTLSKLTSEGIRAQTGSIVTVETAVSSAAGKGALYQRTHSLASDMESGAIARAAAESNIPFLALRVVIDAPSKTLDPVLAGCLDAQGKIRFQELWSGLCCRPSLLLEMVRMTRDLTIALSVLRRAWGALLRHALPALVTAAPASLPSGKRSPCAVS